MKPVENRRCLKNHPQKVLQTRFSILLGNAVKFVAPGVEPEVWIWAEQSHGRATFSFRDNGIGIAPSTQRHLFGIFQRHDSHHEGTGIGLAIARKLGRRMGGEVGVESAAGKGSRFWLELKLASFSPGSPATVPPAQTRDKRPAENLLSY